MTLVPFDEQDDPANSASTGHRTLAALVEEERELRLEQEDRELEHGPADWWMAMCPTCSPLYRPGRSKCPKCGNWRRP